MAYVPTVIGSDWASQRPILTADTTRTTRGQYRAHIGSGTLSTATVGVIASRTLSRSPDGRYRLPAAWAVGTNVGLTPQKSVTSPRSSRLVSRSTSESRSSGLRTTIDTSGPRLTRTDSSHATRPQSGSFAQWPTCEADPGLQRAPSQSLLSIRRYRRATRHVPMSRASLTRVVLRTERPLRDIGPRHRSGRSGHRESGRRCSIVGRL